MDSSQVLNLRRLTSNAYTLTGSKNANKILVKNYKVSILIVFISQGKSKAVKRYKFEIKTVELVNLNS
jgi:hypothetical protein